SEFGLRAPRGPRTARPPAATGGRTRGAKGCGDRNHGLPGGTCRKKPYEPAGGDCAGRRPGRGRARRKLCQTRRAPDRAFLNCRRAFLEAAVFIEIGGAERATRRDAVERR